MEGFLRVSVLNISCDTLVDLCAVALKILIPVGSAFFVISNAKHIRVYIVNTGLWCAYRPPINYNISFAVTTNVVTKLSTASSFPPSL
jgi:hypothetical protein